MLRAFCDGLCEPVNPGGVATYGWVIYDDVEKIAQDCAVVCSGNDATNNVAEYSAIISAMKWLKENGYAKRKIEICSDSLLCINQMAGTYEVRSLRILPLYKEAKKCAEQLMDVRFRWIPREENNEADELSQEAYRKFFKEAKIVGAKQAVTGKPVCNIKTLGKGKFSYWSVKNNIEYLIDVNKTECTCPDYVMRQKKRGGKCKHLMAIDALLENEKEGGPQQAVN